MVQAEDEVSKLKALSERFLSQSQAKNARDPELCQAQSLVAQTISIVRARCPDEPVKASKEVEARRQKVAIRIAKGDRIAVIQVRNQQAQRVREITNGQVLQRGRRTREDDLLPSDTNTLWLRRRYGHARAASGMAGSGGRTATADLPLKHPASAIPRPVRPTAGSDCQGG